MIVKGVQLLQLPRAVAVGGFAAVVALSACGANGGRTTTPDQPVGDPVPSEVSPVDSPAPTVAPEPPASEYRLGPIDQLTESGEGTLEADLVTSMAAGPLRGPDGKTYGTELHNPLPDYLAVLDPNDPNLVVVGFVSQAEGWAPPSAREESRGRTVYGFGGAVVGTLVNELHPADEFVKEPYYMTRFVPA